MDKRRQSILKQDGRIPLQETALPDFPEEDTATVTVTKSRRVSFGANFVKEFIVGSAVSAQFYSEYEQAVSSSDSSNQNTSRSGMLDQSTFQGEDDALNLCVKQALQDEFGHLKKKFCSEKLNSYGDLTERNNENLWDFNVGNGSNIFTEKNMSCSNKAELPRNGSKFNKKASPLGDSSLMDKQFQNKRNKSELNSSKMDETIEKKAKIGKFSSTIFFSADSPTADVEFTEGCISLAKSIFDKKKKEMTVYIKGMPKESKKEDESDGNNTVIFESDDSDVGLKLTKCVDELESENDASTGNFSKYFPPPKDLVDSSGDFDESHGNIENLPFHVYSLNALMGREENSQSDAELERSLFSPERSLTEMLHSDPLKTTISDVVSSPEKDNTEECDMELSSPDSAKPVARPEVLDGGKGETDASPLKASSSAIGSPSLDEEQNDSTCTSAIFSEVGVGDDLSPASEDTAESGFLMADPLKISMSDDSSSKDSLLDSSTSSSLKITGSAIREFGVREVATTAAGDLTSNASSSSIEDLSRSSSKEESEGWPLTQDNCMETGAEPDEFRSMDENANGIQMENCVKEPEDGDDALSLDSEVATCEQNSVKDIAPTNVNGAVQPELFQAACARGENEKSYLQETQFGDGSFLSRSLCKESDRTSLGDKKILSLLVEQSEESNCGWTIDSIDDHEGDIVTWNFSIPVLKSSAIMKFKLRPPKDKSLVSFSIVIDGILELQESNEYQMEKHRVGIDYGFDKLKSYFLHESRGLGNVHKMPLFLDKMNLMANKMNGILGQIIRILKEYPGSQLKESVLSFRIYSFPLLFSYLIAVDVSDPFHLSDNSVTVKKQFGDFSVAKVKSMFKDCLESEDSLVCFVRKITESVMDMEREIGSVTRRSHIRLIW